MLGIAYAECHNVKCHQAEYHSEICGNVLFSAIFVTRGLYYKSFTDVIFNKLECLALSLPFTSTLVVRLKPSTVEYSQYSTLMASS
jgi:hypothetical protein